MKKMARKLWLYYKYPNQFWADYYTFLNKPKARKLGIEFLEPNYIYFPGFREDSIFIDVGCGFLAEFSIHLIRQFGLTAYGVDPTKKHAQNLSDIMSMYPGKFIHVPVAVASRDGKISFHETLENESGSLLNEHVNVLHDQIRTYDVETRTIKTFMQDLKLKRVDFLKLDIEGAEFDLLDSIEGDDLGMFDQIFIEFHHVAVKKYTSKDTARLVRKIKNFGFKVFSLDKVNYLFYKA
jgi:FkbM family methyltransferase